MTKVKPKARERMVHVRNASGAFSSATEVHQMQFVPREIHECETYVVETVVEGKLDGIREEEMDVRHHSEGSSRSREGELQLVAGGCRRSLKTLQICW